MPINTDPTLFASELKQWRHHRRYSQLQLADHAQVSQRHLSFLENGRSRPSPEMVEHLSIVLGRRCLHDQGVTSSGYSRRRGMGRCSRMRVNASSPLERALVLSNPLISSGTSVTRVSPLASYSSWVIRW